MSALASPRLRRLARAARTRDDERCDLCGGAIGERHAHIFDCETRALQCACRPCSILFDHGGSGGSRFRLVRSGVRRVGEVPQLPIPVELAYLVRGDDGRVRAYYPSPAGPVESLLAIDAGSELPPFAPEVEALLVDRVRETNEAWIVGIDTCYRLVALMRRHWHGFTGGDAVKAELDRFFQELRTA